MRTEIRPFSHANTPLNALFHQASLPRQCQGAKTRGLPPASCSCVSQINSGSSPNRDRKGNFERRLGENVQHASLMQPGLSKQLLQTEPPKTPWWQEDLGMDVTSKACCWGRQKESLEQRDFFFPPQLPCWRTIRERTLCVKVSGKEFRQIKQTIKSLGSITSH